MVWVRRGFEWILKPDLTADGEMTEKPGDNFHIGRQILSELRRQERTVTWFARQVCCTRQHAYRIFEKDNLDIVLLLRICRILNRDFFKDISQQLVSPD